MAERCFGDIEFSTSQTVDELKVFFPKLDVYHVGAEFVDASRGKSGVFVMERGSSRHVRIKGGCPNFQNGGCSLVENCFAKVAGNSS